MVKITFYDYDEEMWDDLPKAMKSADERVTEEQKKYRPGDIVVSDSGYGFQIFHEILDIEKAVEENYGSYGMAILFRGVNRIKKLVIKGPYFGNSFEIMVAVQ